MKGAGIRSLLFVPGDSEAKALKALGSEADAVILDLEDGVAPGAKAAARAVTRAILDQADRRGKAVFVRVNALDTGMTAGDLAAVVGGRPRGVVLPKCGDLRDVEQIAFYLDALEAREGVAEGSTEIVTVATETAAATLNLGVTHRARPPRLSGAMWGSEDLAASLGAQTNRDAGGVYTYPYQFARSQCLYAANGLGIEPIDAVYSNFRDLAGLEAETRDALRDGFTAKAAIHPAQVEVINRVLTPDSDQLGWARQVVELLADQGVAQLDGKMIDLAHKRIADRLLQRAAAITRVAS